MRREARPAAWPSAPPPAPTEHWVAGRASPPPAKAVCPIHRAVGDEWAFELTNPENLVKGLNPVSIRQIEQKTHVSHEN